MTLSVVVFLAGGILIYNLLHQIFRHQLDENLNEEKLLIEQTINFSDSVPDFRLIFGHMIDVTIQNAPLSKNGYISDTLMYDQESGSFASFRHLFAESTSYHKKGYTINIYKPLHESERLIAEIILYLALVLLTLLLLLIAVNYFITRRVWVPFYRTLNTLSRYEIDQVAPLALSSTDIHEFNLLNDALEKMSAKIRTDYFNLKEFTDNAAHELQTPLAIIRSKLELLVQREDLDESQFQMVSAMFDASGRMSRMIQGLLLISKIENKQIHNPVETDLSILIDRSLTHFEELIHHRNITVSSETAAPFKIVMDPSLAEILIGNLVSNAIRHNLEGGSISVVTTPDRIMLSNTGATLGSDPEELFGRFVRKTQHKDSTGLGLPIVRKIATLYRLEVTYSFREGVHILEIFRK